MKNFALYCLLKKQIPSDMSIFQSIIKLLTFRISRQEFLEFDKNHFIIGLIGTWIVGMGRYWDDSIANFLHRPMAIFYNINFYIIDFFSCDILCYSCRTIFFHRNSQHDECLFFSYRSTMETMFALLFYKNLYPIKFW